MSDIDVERRDIERELLFGARYAAGYLHHPRRTGKQHLQETIKKILDSPTRDHKGE